MNDEKFKIIDENDQEREATIITIFEHNEKEYVVYSIDSNDEECDILVSRLVENPDGTQSVEDIDDDMERKEIHEIVNELVNA